MREPDLKNILINIESKEKSYSASELEGFLTRAILTAQNEKEELDNNLVSLLMVKIQRTQKDEAIKDRDKMIDLLNAYNNQSQARMNNIESNVQNGFREVNGCLKGLKKTLESQNDKINDIEGIANDNNIYIKENKDINKEMMNNYERVKARDLYFQVYSKNIITVAGVIGAIITILAFLRSLLT